MKQTRSSYPFPRIREIHRSLYEGSGLDEKTIALATRTTDLPSKNALSAELTERLIRRRARQRSGETQLAARRKALSDRTIATFAVNMLFCCMGRFALPPELVRLFAVLHNLESPANDQEHAQWKPTAAVTFFGFHPDASIREVARLIDVAPNTLRAWMRRPEFMESIERVRYFAGPGGGFTPLWLQNEILNRPPRKR